MAASVSGTDTAMTLRVLPLELSEANAAIRAWHRHHAPVVGHRFSIGCVDDAGVLHGVCVMGRPVARLAGHPRDVLEVTRLATDGTRNACSILYAAAARAARALGYLRVQTYVLESESGASLRGAAWVCEGPAGGGQWVHTDGRPRRADQPTGRKVRYAFTFPARPALSAVPSSAEYQLALPGYDGETDAAAAR